MKKVYQALTLEDAEYNYLGFEEKWGQKHPIVIKSWKNNWLELTAFLHILRIYEELYTRLISSKVLIASLESNQDKDCVSDR